MKTSIILLGLSSLFASSVFAGGTFGVTCPALLVFTDYDVSVTGLSPFVARLSRLFTCIIKSLRANPISLAATFGISVDFSSSGYLDVSVPPVRLLTLCIQVRIRAYARGFPHSEIPDSNGCYYLIWAYRKLLRLSSPLTASLLCSSSLRPTTSSMSSSSSRITRERGLAWWRMLAVSVILPYAYLSSLFKVKANRNPFGLYG